MKQTLARKNMSKLDELLKQAEAMFPNTEKASVGCYNFTLGRFPDGWSFDVVNSWHKWMDKGLRTSFGLYSKPEYAVAAFLKYVREKNINVMRLAEKPRKALTPTTHTESDKG